MRSLYLSDKAVADLERIGEYTVDQHGAEALDRYLVILDTALAQIAENPERNGCKPSLKEVTKYHLNHARETAKKAGADVRNPRHVIFFRLGSEDEIEVVRILHDSMDFDRYL